MFTSATKNLGVWREEKKHNIISHCIFSTQFMFSLSLVAFIIFLVLLTVVKIRQDFFLIESSPINLYVTPHLKIDSGFLIPERPSAIAAFIKKENNNAFSIYFEDGNKFLIPNESKEWIAYLVKRRNNIIYTAMLLRINDKKNSRVKIWTQNNIPSHDIKLVMKVFSQYGFNSFDFVAERK